MTTRHDLIEIVRAAATSGEGWDHETRKAVATVLLCAPALLVLLEEARDEIVPEAENGCYMVDPGEDYPTGCRCIGCRARDLIARIDGDLEGRK